MSKDSRKPAPFETEAEANVLLRAVADQAGLQRFSSAGRCHQENEEGETSREEKDWIRSLLIFAA